jgi:homocysteine S-methyltransferase
VPLPYFAAYPLLGTTAGRARMRAHHDPYVAVARALGLGYVAGTGTWRASPGWGARLGHDPATLARLVREGVAVAAGVREANPDVPVLISGSLGPRGDAYAADRAITAAEAREYHAWQVEVLAGAGADRVTATGIGSSEEAIGVALAAGDAGLPVVVSYTLETDGRLPGGETLADAVRRLDDATAGAALFVMVNCAHPAHIAPALAPGADWTARIGGLRANASRRSHAELDEADVLDEGDPRELAEEHVPLREVLPGLTLLGGCCGTDARHVEAIARRCWCP